MLAPKTSYHCNGPVEQLEIDADATLDFPPQDGVWGESTADASMSFERFLRDDLLLTLDAAYGFERSTDESISGANLTSDDHTIEAWAGLEWEFAPITFNLDAGAVSVLHGKMQREDGERFDRSAQDYFEPEIALRMSVGPEELWQPFVEIAYGGRRYLAERSLTGVRRQLSGPEIIAGIQTEQKHVQGQIAAIFLVRNYAEGGTDSTTVIGPYIDVTWTPYERTQFHLAAAATIDHETTGGVAGDPYYSSKLDISYELGEDLTLLGSSSFEFEDEAGPGGTLTVTPDVKVTWQYSNSAAFIAGAGVSWEKSFGTDPSIAATLRAGWLVTW